MSHAGLMVYGERAGMITGMSLAGGKLCIEGSIPGPLPAGPGPVAVIGPDGIRVLWCDDYIVRSAVTGDVVGEIAENVSLHLSITVMVGRVDIEAEAPEPMIIQVMGAG